MSAKNNVPGIWRRGSAIFLVVLFGCAVGPAFHSPASPTVDRYTQDSLPQSLAADGKTQWFEQNLDIPERWWQLFGSNDLNVAVTQALNNNFSLKSAQASLRQSQESLRAGYGVFYPTVDLGFSAVRERTSPFKLGLTTGGSVFNLFTLSTTVSYLFDIFGSERRSLEALAAQTDYQRYTMVATYLSVSGNIVNTLIARAAYQAEIRATEVMIQREEEQLAITQTQEAAGTVPFANVVSIRSQIAASRASIPPLQQKIDQAEHLLATLVGTSPAEWVPPRIDITDLTLPSDLPVSLPAALVRQRPDILAAEAQLHAASANIGVATAALFPSFSLSGAYGGNNTTIGTLDSTAARFWSIGPAVEVPVFHGGALTHQRQAAIEAYRKSLADYRQMVLTAFSQVADTLTALEHDAQALQAQADAVAASTEALRFLEVNYRAGLVNYLSILIADTQLLQAKIAYLQAQAQRHQDTTALFLALGGGWWHSPSTAKPLAHKETGP